MQFDAWAITKTKTKKCPARIQKTVKTKTRETKSKI